MNNHAPIKLHSDNATTARLAQKVVGIADMFRANARRTEEDGKVPQDHIEALHEIGYFNIVKPRSFGGDAGRFSDLVEANIEVASACGSTGWVAGLLSAHQWLLAMFPQEAQVDVWGDNPKALLCGSYAPVRTAERAEGGYRLSGDWAFASGVENAQWAFCAAFLPKPDGSRGVPAFLLVPRKDYKIKEDWDVVGLAGTGSKSILLDNVFVPEHRVLTFPAATTGITPGGKVYGDEGLFNMPLLTGIPSCLAAAGVGCAKGALNAYLDHVGQRVTRGAVAGANNRMAEFSTIQLRVADAAASVDAASEILIRDVARAQDLAQARLGGSADFTIDDRMVSRRGQSFAVSLALRAVQALNESTGGAGLNLNNPVQRFWRDANAVGRHISMNWDAVGTMVGQHMLGLDPKGQY